MAVDAGDNLHLAYYDVLNGGLWYSYIPSGYYTDATNNPIETVRVDTYLSAGTKIMINTRMETRNVEGVDRTAYVPYITYFHR